MRVIQHCNLFKDRLPPQRNRVKYCDDNRPYTLVLEIPDFSFWKDALRANDLSSIFKVEIGGEIGISIVNPVDQFDRKKGLKLALESLKFITMTVEELRLKSNGDIVVALNIAGQSGVMVSVGRSKDRAIVMRNYSFDILNMHRTIYGKEPHVSCNPKKDRV